MSRYFLFACLVLFSITPLQAKVLLILGDSLSASYGFDPDKGWVNLLSERLQRHSPPWKVVNLSVSGATTANGLAKLPAALITHKPAIVVIELGANDGLRGLSLQKMRQNLEGMIRLSRQHQATVLLLATTLPPNYGPGFLDRFNKIYKDLALKYEVTLVPGFLEGVAGNAGFMQQDNLHPNAQAQQRILENIWNKLKPLLDNQVTFS